MLGGPTNLGYGARQSGCYLAVFPDLEGGVEYIRGVLVGRTDRQFYAVYVTNLGLKGILKCNATAISAMSMPCLEARRRVYSENTRVGAPTNRGTSLDSVLGENVLLVKSGILLEEESTVQIESLSYLMLPRIQAPPC